MKTQNSQYKIRSNAATLALSAAIVLTIFKFIAAYLSGSVGVLSEGVHSLLDLISAAIAFFAIKEAGRPADDQHPFGHGKIETLSSLFETLLLMGASFYIFFEGIDRLMFPKPIENEWIAIGTIFISMIVSYLVYLHNIKAAVATESPAIRVNALHYLADVASSVGILIGLLIIQFTGWLVVDSIMAFGVALYIFYTSIRELRKVISELIDSRLPESERNIIKEILNHSPHVLGYHWMRTRKSGNVRHIDFHMMVCRFLTVEESHQICDQIEDEIKSKLSSCSIRIHVEPCTHREKDVKQTQIIDCLKTCPFPERKKI